MPRLAYADGDPRRGRAAGPGGNRSRRARRRAPRAQAVGRRFAGLCPFHTEKSPSFSINPEQGVYYCFGCQKSGDAITFVREVEHLDFVDAVERLARACRHHAPLRRRLVLRGPQAQAAAARSRGRGDRVLPRAAPRLGRRGHARRYLRSRGFDGDVARTFSLGWSPDGYDVLSRHLQKQKFSRDDIVDAGLAFVNKANKLQDCVPGPGDVPDLGRAGRRRSGSAAARSTTAARSTRTRAETPHLPEVAAALRAATGRRARSSRAARSSSARATPT